MIPAENTTGRPRSRAFPPWIRVRVSAGEGRDETAGILRGLGLHTVCEGARCPNLGECWHNRSAAFMILGDHCTRNCRFCAVGHHAGPPPPDPDEPAKVAEAAKRMGLKYAVVTSVTRDDLPDGGASFFAAAVRALKKAVPEIMSEVLTPDFKDCPDALQTVLDAGPSVFNHNIETVARLSPLVRDKRASHKRSLALLAAAAKAVKGSGTMIKSGLMAGMGETDEEIVKTIFDLKKAGVEIITIGQYLPPGEKNWELKRYVPPEKFEEWSAVARQAGFTMAFCGPMVRSSYHAGEIALSAAAVASEAGKHTEDSRL